jgi:hypothetical protein
MPESANGKHLRMRVVEEAAQSDKGAQVGTRDLKKGGGALRREGESPSAPVIYSFIESHKAKHRIGVMCRVPRASKSGFYGWRKSGPFWLVITPMPCCRRRSLAFAQTAARPKVLRGSTAS